MHHPTLRPFTHAARLSLVCLAGLLLALAFIAASPAHTAGVIYVRTSATGANNGTSWATAYTSLQSALTAASSGEEIWVAAGSYTPTTGSDRSTSFTLKNGVAVYSGFAGTETQLSERNWTTNVTILSGAIGMVGTNNDNSYHVVTGASESTLGGFTFPAGYADFSTRHPLLHHRMSSAAIKLPALLIFGIRKSPGIFSIRFSHFYTGGPSPILGKGSTCFSWH
jgi:hypothetical protein